MTDTASTRSTERWWSASTWMHLVWLAALLYQPVFDPDVGVGDWLLVVAVMAVFIPLYLLSYQRPDMIRWWCTVPTILLSVVTLPFNSGASVLLVYTAAFVGYSEPRRYAVRWFFALTVLLGVATLVSPVPMPYRLFAFVPSLILVWVIGVLTMEEVIQYRETDRLRVDNARIEHLATVSERERIARDLHDLLGQSLTSVVMRAQLVRRMVSADPERAAAEAAEIERTARRSLDEVRAAVTGWRQASLDTELEAARQALAAVGVDLAVSRDPKLVIVPSAEQALALALREAVTNVTRHAHARRCQITIDTLDGELRLIVSDDGIGGNAREGSGLAGMRERIAALGGRVQRSGRPGTTLTVAVPVQVAT